MGRNLPGAGPGPRHRLAALLLAAGGALAAPAAVAEATPAVGLDALSARAAARGRDQLEVSLDPALRRLTGRLCLHGERPPTVRAADRQASRWLGAAQFWQRSGAGWVASTLGPAERALELPQGVAGCLTYRVDLAALYRRGAGLGVRLSGRDRVVSPVHWLWRPDAPGRGLELRVVLPPGLAASVPWPAVPDQPGWYRVAGGMPGWRPLVAFLHSPVERVPVADTYLRLAVLDGAEALDPEVMRAWMQACARQLLMVHGRFPVVTPQVLVLPQRKGTPDPVPDTDPAGEPVGDPVPFARVLRDGGPALQFFVDPAARLPDLLADWTAAHEFSHLLLPYVDRDDAWLSEGLASYYQNVLRARAGTLQEAQAWAALAAGFRRGAAGGPFPDSLRETIRWGGPNRTMRLYWSGAVMALLADVELRRGSAGRQSLDSLLEDLLACCMAEPTRTWTGRELFAQLDLLAGRPVFMPLYRRWVHSRAFPAWRPTFLALGIREQGGDIRLDTAVDAALRSSIMGPRAVALPDQRQARPDA